MTHVHVHAHTQTCMHTHTHTNTCRHMNRYTTVRQAHTKFKITDAYNLIKGTDKHYLLEFNFINTLIHTYTQ